MEAARQTTGQEENGDQSTGKGGAAVGLDFFIGRRLGNFPEGMTYRSGSQP